MTSTVEIALGLPGQGMRLGIDPLSLLFLCILAPQAVAGAMAFEWRSAGFWVGVLGMMLALLAADAFALLFGFALMSIACWLAAPRAAGPGPAWAGLLPGAIAAFSVACLVPAVFLPGGNAAFALLLLGTLSQAMLVPPNGWLPGARQASSPGIAAVTSGGMMNVAFYILIRYGFVVDAGAIAPWWGAALLAAGAAAALFGALRAMLEAELDTVLASASLAQAGLIAVGLGVALQARTRDDPALAALALEAALLFVVAQALIVPLLFLGAGAIRAGTGTASLDWLGGLMRGMPRLGLLLLTGVAGLAAIPLFPGFAPALLLWHAVIAAAGSGGGLACLGYGVVLGMLGLGAGLMLAASVRIIGVGFLGRPRTLRAAAAGEAEKPVLLGMALLAVMGIPVALIPAALLRAMAPVFAMLIPNGQLQPIPYAPLPLALLLLALTGLAFLVLRRFGTRAEREAAAWNGGFGKPPAWLPFGDPLTQPSATGFAEPTARALGLPPPWRWRNRRLIRRAARFVARLVARLAARLVTLLGVRLRHAASRWRLAMMLAALAAALLALGVRAG